MSSEHPPSDWLTTSLNNDELVDYVGGNNDNFDEFCHNPVLSMEIRDGVVLAGDS
jgi:hypothetical protein